MDLKIDYPAELPVSAHRAEILAAVRTHAVTIVCGDTGSGKTTQLPKMMLEIGRAQRGRRIAVTQPRRLAAVTMAERVAKELGGANPACARVGGLVGFRHRYARELSSETRIEFLTDGVLLAETRSDPLLRRYDTIIVDEAHERSLNVDFLLGILTRILRRRRDLKVVIASATMDTEKFAAFFDAPVVSVPGRLFPIEMRYRPPADGEEFDLSRWIVDAVDELSPRNDILVFLPGERDIREAAEALEAANGERDDVIPLLASLPAFEQRRAFQPSNRRRIVLATNVAETSVTIPGIRAVIDSGLARISRYVHRTQIQRLQIEPISQASARQRAGRCGRLGPGVCIRLYSEEDFLAREAYTAPEILRSSLAGVILTMLDLRLGDIERFPFIDPPKPTMVREGLRELLELGAIRHETTVSGDVTVRTVGLTEIGRALARLPVEPRLARMLLAASERGVLTDVLPLVAAMACDSPLRRPMDEKEKAAQAHARWRVIGSDFLGTLKLWTWWREETKNLSQAKSRKLAKGSYLSFPKMRDWAELTRQLTSLAHQMKLSFAETPAGETHDALLHQSLLTGLLGRIGHWHTEEREYRGAHALRFSIHPGSALAKGRDRKTPPAWIVAGELVDTARLFARQAATIDPRWIEPLAKYLVKHQVHSPVWDADQGFVRATERVTLYGLVIVEARRCDYARFDPAGAREIFLRHALLLGEFPQPTPIVRSTLAFLAELRQYAERMRAPEVFDEARLLAHFDAILPPEVTNAPALKRFLARAPAEMLARFKLKRADWWPKAANGTSKDFPSSLTVSGVRLRLTYRHEPENPERDGITCTLKRREIPVLADWHSDYLVPGLLRKKVSFLLLSLPNSLQRLLRPFDESLTILMDLLPAVPTEPLTDAIRRAVADRWAFRIPSTAWEKVRLPTYLQVRFVVLDDETGRLLLATRDKKEVLSLVSAAEYKAARQKPVEERIQQLGAEIPFAYTGKFPILVLLYLKEIGSGEGELKADIRAGAISDALTEDGTALRSTAEFVRLETERARLAVEIIREMKHLEGELASAPAETADDILEQLAFLTVKGFTRTVPIDILRRYSRYFKAIDVRLARSRVSPLADRAKAERVRVYWTRYRAALAAPGSLDRAKLTELRWLIEEFRIQTFAQELKTFETVSPNRLNALLARS